jgi:hypothetical protein
MNDHVFNQNVVRGLGLTMTGPASRGLAPGHAVKGTTAPVQVGIMARKAPQAQVYRCPHCNGLIANPFFGVTGGQPPPPPPPPPPPAYGPLSGGGPEIEY